MAVIKPVHEITDLKSNAYIQVNSCGISDEIRYDFSTLREYGRCDYQLIYVSRGRLLAELRGKEITISEGHGLIYIPYEKQYYTFLKKEAPETYWIHFNGNAMDEVMRDLHKIEGQIFAVKDRILFENVFHRLLKCYVANDKTESNGLLLQMLSLLENEANKDENEMESRIKAVALYIFKHYSEKIEIKDLADQVHLSISRFSHLFSDTMGISPHRYILQRRIERAEEMLRSSSLTVNEIALSLGFSSQAHFYHAFLKVVGMSPVAYRNSSI